MNNNKNIVVGAGLSGAVTANLLATKFNEEVLVLDRREHVAGNMYDYVEDGINVSKYGAQVFHTNNEQVWEYVQKFADFNTYMHKRAAFIDGIEVIMPFNLNTVHGIFPEILANKLEKRLLSYFVYDQFVSIAELKQTEDEALNFLAEYLYRKTSPKCLAAQKDVERNDSDVVNTPIIHISVDNRFFKDTYQGMPHAGYTSMIEKMLRHPNIKVHMNTDYQQFLSDTTEKFKRTFYTGSIDEFFGYQFGVLPYQSQRFKFEKHDNKKFFQSNAIVEYPYNYDFVAIHEFKHYYKNSPQCKKQCRIPKTIIAKEYREDFSVNQQKEQRGERSYPVVNNASRELFNKYSEHAGHLKNVFFLGHLGDFQPYSLDEAVLRATEVVNSLQ